jgi:dipeptidase
MSSKKKKSEKPIINLEALKWATPDRSFQELLRHPKKFKPKESGSKNTGLLTGVYEFEHQDEIQTLLIKQGADIGETIAEYVGANLYGLTLPENAAPCILVVDNSKENPDMEDVYVASFYANTESGWELQDAFEAVGFDSRGHFAGTKARLGKMFNKSGSLVRKIIKMDHEQAQHSLGICAASVLWHGDHDFHTGNFVVHRKKSSNPDIPDEIKFIKIDHGFSFFNFKEDVVNILSPFAGKVFKMNLNPAKKNRKLIEFYPTNHFWDFAVEAKLFYFNPQFIKACDDIAALDEDKIRENIHQSLENVKNAYGDNATKSLSSFGKRMGMTSKSISANQAQNVDEISLNIENYMVSRLQERQASMGRLADKCRERLKHIDKNREIYSYKLNDYIIEIEHRMRTIDEKYPSSSASPSVLFLDPAISQNERIKNLPKIQNVKQILEKEIEFIKMLQQANDLGILELKGENYSITMPFYFHHNGKRELISENEFKARMDSTVNAHSLSSMLPFPMKLDAQYPVSSRYKKLVDNLKKYLPGGSRKNKNTKSNDH